jgi:hypothetical protein
LIWRSSHIYSGSKTNPACSNLRIEWLSKSAQIDSIVDVPGDQGGWARLIFSRSSLDFTDEEDLPVTNYYVFRRVEAGMLNEQMRMAGETLYTHDNGLAAAGNDQIKFPSLKEEYEIRVLNNRIFVFSNNETDASLPPGTWEVVGSAPAHQQDQYICLVPTLADSSTTLIRTVYCISAETFDPKIYFFSTVDSGYSVDNIAPAVPQGLTAALIDQSISITWENVPDQDFQFYSIYRGKQSGFIPDESNLLTCTTANQYLDNLIESDSTYFYRVSASDFSGNESDYSAETSCLVTGLNESGLAALPEQFSLQQNYPNPFNPVTTIRYALKQTEHVHLTIYDALGRILTTLVNQEQKGGWYQLKFEASRYPSGIYFYRLTAGPFNEIRKMVLIK